MTKKRTISITRLLFVTTQLSALFWVTISYGIATYATVFLQQPFPVEALSQHAITVILGVNITKTLSNIFEHNNSAVFGTSDKGV